LRDGRLGKSDWNPLIEKVNQRPEGWKEKLLSLEGHITLANVVLLAIPLYFLSFFRMPKWVERCIDRSRRRFLWHDTSAEKGGRFLIIY